MAYKISGQTTESGIIHIFKDDEYLGYKNEEQQLALPIIATV